LWVVISARFKSRKLKRETYQDYHKVQFDAEANCIKASHMSGFFTRCFYEA
jgi:hypothetical protein